MLRLLHQFGVEVGHSFLEVVFLCAEESFADKGARDEVAGDVAPGRGGVLCNGLEPDARWGELRGIKMGGGLLIGAVLAEKEGCCGWRVRGLRWMDYGLVWRVEVGVAAAAAVGEDGILGFDPVGELGTARAPGFGAGFECRDGGAEGIGLAVLVFAGEEEAGAIDDVELFNGMNFRMRRSVAGASVEPEIGGTGGLVVVGRIGRLLGFIGFRFPCLRYRGSSGLTGLLFFRTEDATVEIAVSEGEVRAIIGWQKNACLFYLQRPGFMTWDFYIQHRKNTKKKAQN